MTPHNSSNLQSSLLVLPMLSSRLRLAALKSAYGPALSALLMKMSNEAVCKERHSLDVVIEIDPSEMISTKYSSLRLQVLLGTIYKLIAYVCAENAIDIQVRSVIDIQVLVTFNISRDATDSDSTQYQIIQEVSPNGPLLCLERLAQVEQPWQGIFYPDGKAGDQAPWRELLSLFRKNRNMKIAEHSLPGGSIADHPIQDSFEWHQPSAKQYLSVAVGGTFDHLHLGHRLLLTALALLAAPREDDTDHRKRRLIVGITGDKLLKNKKFGDLVEPWDQRQLAVARFLNAVANFSKPFSSLKPHRISESGPNGHAVHYQFDDNVVVECVEILDPFGPTITDEAIFALIVSGETRAGGQAVNDKRQAMGWAPLEIVEVDVLDAGTGEETGAVAEEFKNKISSTAIRKQLSEQRKHHLTTQST